MAVEEMDRYKVPCGMPHIVHDIEAADRLAVAGGEGLEWVRFSVAQIGACIERATGTFRQRILTISAKSMSPLSKVHNRIGKLTDSRGVDDDQIYHAARELQ